MRHRHKSVLVLFDRQNAIYFMVVLLAQAIKHDAIFVTLREKRLLSIVVANVRLYCKIVKNWNICELKCNH